MSKVHAAPEGGQCGTSLVQIYEMLKSQLDLEGNMPDVFSRACVMLGVPAEGPILDQAARCRAALLGDGSRPRPKPEDVVEEAPVWQREALVLHVEAPVLPEEGAPVLGMGAKVVGVAVPQQEEMAREASGDLKGRAVGIENRSLVPDAWLSASGSWPDAGTTLSRFRQDRRDSSCWSPDKPGKEAKQFVDTDRHADRTARHRRRDPGQLGDHLWGSVDHLVPAPDLPRWQVVGHLRPTGK